MNMAIRYRNFGLTVEDVEAIIDRELDANADVLIGIDDPEVLEMIQVLKKAVAVAISENNRQLESELGG
jgi:hypothetical protein